VQLFLFHKNTFCKQFSSFYLLQAGIDNDHLRIALEPEAASTYCRHLPVDATTRESELAISNLPIGTKYMVLDAGGIKCFNKPVMVNRNAFEVILYQSMSSVRLFREKSK
jgi:hypothetical protein